MSIKRKRKFGLFRRKRGTRRWERMFPDISGTRDKMCRLFQGALISSAVNPEEEMELRPIPKPKD